MASSRPEVSVIVCHHRGDFIYDFIKSIFKSEDVDFEVIVMTSDEELAMVGIRNCIVFHNEGLPAAKRNAGARIARGRFLAFFDDDVTVDPLCLYHLRNTFEESVGMVYGKLWNMEHQDRFDEAGGYLTWTGFIWSRAGQNDKDVGQFNEEVPILAGKSASCMVRTDIFKRVKGFDEDFGILGEETDLSWRIWLLGKTVFYAPTATGLHAFNTKFKPAKEYYTSKRVHYNGCRNYITMLLKNLELKNLWVVPIHMMIWFFAGLALCTTLKFEQGLNIFRGMIRVGLNFPTILKKRKRIQENRNVDDSDIWPSIFRRAPRGYYRTRLLRYITLGLHG